MPFSIDQVVPWGRSAAEYQAMFGLGEADLGGRILGCGDGPASFNAELSAQGRSVVSVDPLYAMSAAAIERRVESTFGEVMDETRRNQDEFVWTHVRSIEELGQRRMTAMRRFIADYPRGKTENRYVDASLPDLPFDNGSFDLALSSHLLFLYSEQLDLDFHLRALEEMLRVSAEVRVFPLLQLGGTASPHVEGIVDAFGSRRAVATVETVAYEFQKGGNRMLRLRRKRTA
ncbi:MAG: class I SAM-dependent methyltransferase [Bryobacterales bacterium]|nr:class I SAM-dependent methyltransferase [Bryobacterales bacterium]